MAMSEETRKRLNRALWMERAKKAGIGVLILAAIGLYMAYENLELQVTDAHVAGVIETIDPFVSPPSAAASTAPAQALTVGVKLDDGRHVRVIAEKSREPKVGARIDIVQHTHGTGRVTHSLK